MLASICLVWVLASSSNAGQPASQRRLGCTRRVFATAGGAAALAPAQSRAGRVEDMLDFYGEGSAEVAASRGIAGAVQQSDLGLSVRRRVVRGAQFADALDAQWDAISFKARNLGRRQAPQQPPPRRRIDADFARAVRDAGAAAVASACGVRATAVDAAVDAARVKYASVFESRSNGSTTAPFDDEKRVSFEVYCTFRAFNEFVTPATGARFEAAYGDLLLEIPVLKSAAAPQRAVDAASLQRAADGAEALVRAFEAAGVVQNVAIRAAAPEEDDDYYEDAEFRRPISFLLSDPAELPARLLLESQARRLQLTVLPDAVASAVRAYYLKCGLEPKLEEYFVDTTYRTAFDRDDYSQIQLEVILPNTFK